MFYVKVPDKKECSFNGGIKNINEGNLFYIPLVVGKDTNVTTLVKKGDFVSQGQKIANTKGDFKTNVISSITGEVLGFEEKTYLTNEKVRCVLIKKTEEDKIFEKTDKKISDMSKQDFLDKLKESGLVGLSGAAFPTYYKYSTEKQINTLIVNAVECESYITADQKILLTKIEEILEATDAILEIFDIPEAIIVIKSKNKKLKDAIEDFVGTYLKIRVEFVSDHYTMGYEKNIIKEVKNITYEKYPLEKGIVVNNVSTIYAIYEVLKLNKPLFERMITVTGDGIKEPTNFVVKTGMLFKDIVDQLSGYTSDNITIVAGGPMMGESISNDDLVMSPNLNNILVLKDFKQEEKTACLRCGKCMSYCTAEISPVLIKDALEDVNKLKELRPDKCVECGLCSYICPAKIPIREYVREAKKEIGGS